MEYGDLVHDELGHTVGWSLGVFYAKGGILLSREQGGVSGHPELALRSISEDCTIRECC